MAERAAFHVMSKPIGPICNLDCKYCFYLEKQRLYPDQSNFRMRDDVLERYVRQYIEAQDVPEVNFAWQGGEPTLMGLEFFKRVVELQRQYANGKRITNALQTNGTLLDDAWCEFLREQQFLIGLSIDGPRELHDRYRLDKKGQPTFDRVMHGMGLLKKHGVDFNTLCVVNRANSQKPLDVYRFLKTEGSGFIQFIPLVERLGGEEGLAEPPLLKVLNPPPTSSSGSVAPWSVEPLAFGEFLCEIFDEWVRQDVGRVFVQLFDVQLGIWMGMPSTLCVFGETCGSAVALEHNGDLYACDHYVYPRYKLGSIMDANLRELVDSPQQQAFGQEKRDTLPRFCRECDVRFACNGECPKHRFMRSPNGEAGVNYLCAGYKRFFHHIDPYMKTMAQLLRQHRPAAEIMPMLRQQDHRNRPTGAGEAGRNSPCPCGSGRKYKKCCWDKDHL
ncbi:MAG: anaerobic sulfatase maturase [Bacillota bacterium]